MLKDYITIHSGSYPMAIVEQKKKDSYVVFKGNYYDFIYDL